MCCKDEPVTPPPTQPPTTTEVPLAISTKDIPKPGECGIDFENRIYGGNRVSKSRFRELWIR